MMTAQAEYQEMVRVNVRRTPDARRLRKELKAAVHAEVVAMTHVPIHEIMEWELKDHRRLQARWLLMWGLYEILGMSSEGIGRYLRRDRSTIRRSRRLAVKRYPQECQELWRRCNP